MQQAGPHSESHCHNANSMHNPTGIRLPCRNSRGGTQFSGMGFTPPRSAEEIGIPRHTNQIFAINNSQHKARLKTATAASVLP